MKVHVDVDACTGHGRCYVLAPEVFEPDDAGYCVIVSEQVPGDLTDKAWLAVRSCPENAITAEP